MTAELDLVHWRRSVAELYAGVRAEPDPQRAHGLWRAGRDELMATHPQSPLLPGDDLRRTGLPFWDYDPALRFLVELHPPREHRRHAVDTGSGDGTIEMRLAGTVQIDTDDGSITLDVWWLDQYAGGLFLPIRDGTARTETYGGGRYLLDTAKGADLGGDGARLIVDLNFLYHPSCRYNPAWSCPLAGPGNTTAVPIRAGERMAPAD